MYKKIMSFALSAAMLLTMVCTFSFTSAEGLMKITAVADKTEVHRGDTVTVTVGIENYTQPLQAITVLCNYDKNLLKNTVVSEIVDIEIEVAPGIFYLVPMQSFPGVVTKNLNRVADSALGEDIAPLYISWANAENQAKDASFTLFTATFEVLEDATLDETTLQFFFGDRGSTYWDETITAAIKTVSCEPGVHYEKYAAPLVLNVQA